MAILDCNLTTDKDDRMHFDTFHGASSLGTEGDVHLKGPEEMLAILLPAAKYAIMWKTHGAPDIQF